MTKRPKFAVLAYWLVPVAVVAFTLPGFLFVPPGHEGVEGGPVDHNWGGHAWSHANVAWALGLLAFIIHRHRAQASLRGAFRETPFLALAWIALVWGAVGMAVDGVLTAFVGDDTTWTHSGAVQAFLQLPLLVGYPLFGLLALVFRGRAKRAQGAAAAP